MINIKRIISILIYSTIIVLILSAVGSVVLKRPILLSAVRSDSMTPVFKRGDVLVSLPLFSIKSLKKGDIIIFKTLNGSLSSKGLISHRIVGGNAEQGFITKGDANPDTDQYGGSEESIKPEWISAVVLAPDNIPMKIPLIGYLPLTLEEFEKTPFVLPLIISILAIIILIEEFGRKKQRTKKTKINTHVIYMVSGIIIIVIAGASMLAASQHLQVNYGVSKTTDGVISGSKIGIIKVGQSAEMPISNLENKSFLPMVATVTANDSQIHFSQDNLVLAAGTGSSITMSVNGRTEGTYKSIVDVGVFYPLLPKNMIKAMAEKSYWLALLIISLIPGLPFIIYPFIDSRMRARVFRGVANRFSRIRNFINI
jgi:signal peptidase I